MSADAGARSLFRASLRLWSDTEPLAQLVRAARWNWENVHVNGKSVPATGRTPARVAPRHYARSEDPKYGDIEDIIPVIAHWLDEIEAKRH